MLKAKAAIKFKPTEDVIPTPVLIKILAKHIKGK